MKIRKFVVLVICLAGLILSLLPVSFSASSISPTTSSMPIPESSYSSGVLKFAIVYYHDTEPHYRVNCVTVNGGSNFRFSESTFLFSDSSYSFTSDVFDVNSGNLIVSSSGSSDYNSYQNRYQRYFQSSDQHVSGLYFIVPEVVSVTYTQKVVDPFVTWSLHPLEHNIYHSQLSEPLADKYNRYFVLDDKLFWVSIRVNGFWVKSADLEGSTGYYQYEALAPQQGGYEYGYQGVLAQYSGYVPVNLNYSGFFNSLPFDLVLLPSTDQWSIGVKSSSIFSDVQSKIDCEFFISEFNLLDGEYLSSSFISFQRDNLSSASFPLSESGSFSDVRCYGVDFYNSDNIPVNLSDVLWEYDLDFVLWRDDMLQKLSDIYNLLSEAESVTSYQAPDLASKLDDENIINDFSYNSGDVQQDLNDNIDRGIQALGSDGGQLQSLTSQIVALGNGKIFSLLIISLSLGVLILILGKNKND